MPGAILANIFLASHILLLLVGKKQDQKFKGTNQSAKQETEEKVKS